MAPTKCPCECPRKKKKTTKPRKTVARKSIQPAQQQPSVIMMPQPSRVISAVSQISGSEKPVKSTREMATQTLMQQQKEVGKPSKYQRKPITVSDIQKKEVVEPVQRQRGEKVGISVKDIQQKMKTEKEPYKTVLGVNVPVKREGMYVQKESGLLVPEKRGAPTIEEKQMKEMIGQTKLDKFMIKK